MRKAKNILLAATLVFGGGLAGAIAYAYVDQASAATTAPVPPGPGFPPPGGPPPGPWQMDGMDGKTPHGPFPMPPPDMMDHPHHEGAAFALFPRVDNKNLTTADVRTIAQATLLEHGNHSWTVANVTKSADKIDFSYATPHGDIVATFAVDPASGHIERVS